MLALVGHVDEIGFAVTSIGDDGLLAFALLGPVQNRIARVVRFSVLLFFGYNLLSFVGPVLTGRIGAVGGAEDRLDTGIALLAARSSRHGEHADDEQPEKRAGGHRRPVWRAGRAGGRHRPGGDDSTKPP